MKINRREFSLATGGLGMIASMNSSAKRNRYPGSITDIQGIQVGHYTHRGKTTGCTVVICDESCPAGVDVRGSAPGTRETDLLRPTNMVEKVDAILLSGGSAFGLDAAAGVVRYLEEKGRGFQTGVARVPIVPAAILFDLSVGDPKIRPDAASGYQACLNISSKSVVEGSIGAGAGATVGKILGIKRSMKGGLGTASIRVDRFVVGALFAVNAIGDVVDPASSEVLAGLRSRDGKDFENTTRFLMQNRINRTSIQTGNTTIGIVATNAQLDKNHLTKIAQMSHDGLARAIRPSHLPFDGDTIFSLSCGGETKIDLGQIGVLASEVTSRAIVNAVLAATSIEGIPSYQDVLAD